MQKRRSPGFVYIVATLVFCLLSSHALSQSNKKPKLKDFGSSLKRLKWNPQLNAAVETKRKAEAKTSGDDDVIRVETSLVVADVLVLDQRGQAIPDLTANDFLVTEDNKPQQVGMFSLGDNAAVPRSIVLIVDHSGSQVPFINTSITAAKVLVDKLGPLDQMAIVTDDVELLTDFTSNKKKLKDNLELLRVRSTDLRLPLMPGQRRLGQSKQYSALMATLKEAFSAEDERPIIIFQTDGDEAIYLRDPIIVPSVTPGLPDDLRKESEKYVVRALKIQQDKQREFSLNDVFIATQKSRATIYTVVPGFRLIGLSFDEQMKQLRSQLESISVAVPGDRHLAKRAEDRLARMGPESLKYDIDRAAKFQEALAAVATISGGWTEFLERPAQADEIYSRILSDINTRYLVGYYPTNKERDGKRRKIKIEVRGHPEYTVIGRKSYYAPDPDQ